MKAGVISPIPLLESYSAFTNYHICKPSLLLDSEDYLNFYRKMKERGDFIILDCSDKLPRRPVRDFGFVLKDILKRIKPDLVVAPDWDMHSTRTVEMTVEFLREYGRYLKERGLGILGVIQGSTPEQVRFCYKMIYKLVDAIGLPRSLEASVGRVKFLKGIRTTKPIHILGIHQSPEKEVDDLLDLERDSIVGLSCDIPVRLGFSCRLLDEVKPEPPPLDMFSDYNPFPGFTFENVEEFILMVEGE